MRPIRRIAFHLTPLLDLLLIVIFAQYIEVRDQTRREQMATSQRLQAVERERDEALQAVAALRDTDANDRRRQDDALQRLRSENETLRQQQAELAEALRQAAEQRDRVGALTALLFDVPPELMTRALEAPAAERTPAEVERLRAQFRELAQMRAGAAVKHLLTYDELRKRADVWDVYVAETGEIAFSAGEQRRTFRADTPETFAARLYDIYKSLPQPKGLVIILLSYGDAKAVWREAAIKGLPQAAARMREDAAGRTRFEYAVLGFRPPDAG